MTLKMLMKEAMSLSTQERLELAEVLWRSVPHDETAQVKFPSAHAGLLHRSAAL